MLLFFENYECCFCALPGFVALGGGGGDCSFPFGGSGGPSSIKHCEYLCAKTIPVSALVSCSRCDGTGGGGVRAACSSGHASYAVHGAAHRQAYVHASVVFDLCPRSGSGGGTVGVGGSTKARQRSGKGVGSASGVVDLLLVPTMSAIYTPK